MGTLARNSGGARKIENKYRSLEKEHFPDSYLIFMIKLPLKHAHEGNSQRSYFM
jgi:hypothetical protein